MAGIGKRKKTAHRKAPKRKARKQVIVVGKRTHHKKRKVSGTGIGKVHHVAKRRKKSHGFLGSTGGGGTVVKIVKLAAGVGAGALVTHIILRPLEHKVAAKYPMVTKFLGLAEIGLGGYIAIVAKKEVVKAFGIGILAGGTHTVMKQLPFGLHNPAENAKVGDFTTLNVPMNGGMRENLAGLIENNPNRYVQTPVVSGLIRNSNGGVRTNVVNGVELYRTNTVNGSDDMGDLSETDRDWLFTPRGL